MNAWGAEWVIAYSTHMRYCLGSVRGTGFESVMQIVVAVLQDVARKKEKSSGGKVRKEEDMGVT